MSQQCTVDVALFKVLAGYLYVSLGKWNWMAVTEMIGGNAGAHTLELTISVPSD